MNNSRKERFTNSGDGLCRPFCCEAPADPDRVRVEPDVAGLHRVEGGGVRRAAGVNRVDQQPRRRAVVQSLVRREDGVIVCQERVAARGCDGPGTVVCAASQRRGRPCRKNAIASVECQANGPSTSG